MENRCGWIDCRLSLLSLKRWSERGWSVSLSPCGYVCGVLFGLAPWGKTNYRGQHYCGDEGWFHFSVIVPQALFGEWAQSDQLVLLRSATIVIPNEDATSIRGGICSSPFRVPGAPSFASLRALARREGWVAFSFYGRLRDLNLQPRALRSMRYLGSSGHGFNRAETR